MTTTTDPTAAGLLRTILAEPDDDGARLALADLLMERDDPRGEFIAVQAELARRADELCPVCVRRWQGVEDTDCCHCPKPIGEMNHRSFVLLNRHAARWFVPEGWRIHTTGCGGQVNFFDGRRVYARRGFVEHVTLPTAAFLEHAAALFAAQPVTRVTFSDKRPYGREGDFIRGWCDSPDLRPGTSHIGPDLWRLLPKEGRVIDGWRHYKNYADEDLALAALSVAAVSFGRAAAGL